ncbi:MAG TPA: DMT family transporter [Thiobacillus sp.]|nr:MAG: EamA family transporter [Hydrogenophilales bacterium 17-61-76]HQT72154.1 DMT family transporter [Thiobacillus sp.]
MSIPAAYLTVILIWATTPLAIKWSAQGVGFSFAVASRMAIGLVVAGLIIAIWRVGLPLHRRARMSYLVSGLSLFGAMTLTYWGSQYIHSGLISVLFGLSPLVTGVLALLWLKEEALTPKKLLGMLLGLAGLAVIFGDTHEMSGSHAVAGVTALLAAVLVYSSGMVWIKRIGDDSPPLATTAGALAVSLPLFGMVWWLMDGHIPAAIPARAEAAIVYLGVFGSVLGFALYYYVIKHMETGKVSLITLVTPVIALLLGSLLNGEDVSMRVWIGVICIVLGLAIHQWQSLVALAISTREGD